jgi:hypothetical protein
VPAAIGGFFVPANGRALFQSDHAFDAFVSPVSNPFLFEDPRALTEVKPLFIYQRTPGISSYFSHSNIFFVGAQGRVALTDRLSFVVSELGWNDFRVHNSNGTVLGRSDFSELRLGPKYTFLRNDSTCTLLAGGLSFDINTSNHFTSLSGPSNDLSLRPYLSFGQNFKTGVGDFNFLNTTGYSFGTNNRPTDFFYSSFHVDYDVAGWKKLYPFIELNWFWYTQNGDRAPLGFEGRDLYNFGFGGVAGHQNSSLALGARYKFSECIQTGGAIEFPLWGPHYLMDFRITLDVIFRY